MHQNLAVILQQFNYGKNSFIVLIPKNKPCEWAFTNCSVDCAEEDCETNVWPVPDVIVVNGGNAEEHEDDRFRGAAQHLHGVLQGRLRVGGNVSLDVVLASDAAECDAVEWRKVLSRVLQNQKVLTDFLWHYIHDKIKKIGSRTKFVVQLLTGKNLNLFDYQWAQSVVQVLLLKCFIKCNNLNLFDLRACQVAHLLLHELGFTVELTPWFRTSGRFQPSGMRGRPSWRRTEAPEFWRDSWTLSQIRWRSPRWYRRQCRRRRQRWSWQILWKCPWPSGYLRRGQGMRPSCDTTPARQDSQNVLKKTWK